MKSHIFKIQFIFLLCIATISCENFLDENLNVDPNKPSSVPVSAMLPSIGINIADVTGGDFSRFNCLLTQQVEGVARQWTSFNSYTGLTPNRFDTAWTNLYEAIFIELDIYIKQSEELGANHYLGIGQILQAYSLMLATDVWGDIPYTEAGQGLDNTSPVYDDQATVIYPAIFSLLQSGIENLGKNDGGFAVEGDVFYGGDTALWIKAARAIRARAHLHQDNYADALTDAQASFTSRSDNLRFTYEATKPGQWHRFNDGRTGDIEFHPFMSGLMTALNDTDRLAIFSETFVTGHSYLIDAFGQDLISYREIKFIEAECLLRTGGSDAAISTAYLAGIEASFEEVGLTNAQYTTYIGNATVNPGVGSIALDPHVYTQKYIGLFVQPEVYNDYRRTGFPNLTPTSGTQVPVRWNYSSDELLFNTNTPGPSEADLYKPRVDWNL
ncbi:SusD/RagB family nutrient-binding outer membrane lipoprotein [Aquimarina sp. AU58]|uniref:SusD/RagB family nutrient-binding outer membrane lipoprotein n=1 Tax=Aquimarina sp. AU58 TaxID=1874112 RepID=UPI000D6575F4|nr:SusD/RagB family nutrient-binding outer membrane lipoprotein [Aquimarina sp. AU58]